MSKTGTAIVTKLHTCFKQIQNQFKNKLKKFKKNQVCFNLDADFYIKQLQ